MSVIIKYIEILAYLGILSAFSTLFLQNAKLRKIVLIIASFFFLIYSVFIKSIPFIIVFVAVTIYLIIISIKSKKNLSPIKIVEVNCDNNYIIEFLNVYRKDIYNHFPFYEPQKHHKCFLITKDLNFAGVLIASIDGTKLLIEVDYTKPLYRDTKIGDFLFNKNIDFFIKRGVNEIVAKSYHKAHSKYLQKLGFEQIHNDNEYYFVKKIYQ